MSYQCPVCGYNRLSKPPQDYTICPCCGTEFEVDDFDKTYDQLRAEWLRNPVWSSRRVAKPTGWSPYTQLANLSGLQAKATSSATIVRLGNTQRVVRNLFSSYRVDGHWELLQTSGEVCVASA